MASSNTVFKPFWVNAEHSKYFTEPISLAIAKPCEFGTEWREKAVNETFWLELFGHWSSLNIRNSLLVDKWLELISYHVISLSLTYRLLNPTLCRQEWLVCLDNDDEPPDTTET